MISPRPAARAQLKLHVVLGAVVVMLFGAPSAVNAQGLVQGVRQGAKAGNKAAGPVGGVLGGAIGGVVGVFTGVLGVPANNETSVRGPVQESQTGNAKAAKAGKAAKGAKGAKPAQEAEPQPLTADQIVEAS